MEQKGAGLTDEVAILEVKTIQLVASGFGIHHVLIDDERSSLGIVGDALADLATRASQPCSLLPGRFFHPHRRAGWKFEEVIPDRTKLAEEIKEFLGRDVVAV